MGRPPVQLERLSRGKSRTACGARVLRGRRTGNGRPMRVFGVLHRCARVVEQHTTFRAPYSIGHVFRFLPLRAALETPASDIYFPLNRSTCRTAIRERNAAESDVARRGREPRRTYPSTYDATPGSVDRQKPSRRRASEVLAWNRLAIRGSGCSTVPAAYVAACRSAIEAEAGSYLPLDLMGDVIDQPRADGAAGPRVQGEEFSNPVLASPFLVLRRSLNVLGGHREPVDLGPEQYPT